MQPLEFVPGGSSRIFDHASHSQCIVGRELRIEPRPCRQQFLHAVEVAKICHRLAGEHRIVIKPPLLGALDLGVPIGTFDEANHQPPVERFRRFGDPRDHRASAFLIRLYGETEPIPSGERGIAQHCRNHIERQFQPVGFFGIDSEIELVPFGQLCQLDHIRHQLCQHAFSRQRLIAGMQRRQFDGDSRPLWQRLVTGTLADRIEWRWHKTRNSARHLRRCGQPRPACQMNREIRDASRRATAPLGSFGQGRNANRAAALPGAWPRAPPAPPAA